jgi:hypothetical protein
MKKLMVMAFLMVGMTVLAQERFGRHQGNGMEKFTPEQRSQLQLKQMTLNLDLNEAQQKEMSSIIADKNTKIEAHRTDMKAIWGKEGTPTNDERFAMRSKMIDEQMAIKKRMEKVLNPKQFEKWNALKEDSQGNRQGSCKGNCQGNRQGNRQGNFQGNCQGNR